MGETPAGEFTVPSAESLKLNADAAYLHYTPNETIQGIEFPYVPASGDVRWWVISHPPSSPGRWM